MYRGVGYKVQIVSVYKAHESYKDHDRSPVYKVLSRISRVFKLKLEKIKTQVDFSALAPQRTSENSLQAEMVLRNLAEIGKQISMNNLLNQATQPGSVILLFNSAVKFVDAKRPPPFNSLRNFARNWLPCGPLSFLENR